MSAALQTAGLCKSFGALAVAQNIDFTLPHGARHALIGPNGAGKTTFINLLTGMLTPSAGTVSLLGQDITKMRAHLRVQRGLARTFQINTLFPALTPLEAVTVAICQRRSTAYDWLARLSKRRDAIDETYALLQSVGLAEDCLRPTKELPYGKQRLLEIALALACKPKVLLLDEPAAGVPRGESDDLFAAIAGLPDDLAILFIEHDMELVFRFARRITVLVGGKILREGSPAEIADDPQVQTVYLGSPRH
ncbi:MAG: ABC transporter ATP-binding protein [Rhodospirillales bacterium]